MNPFLWTHHHLALYIGFWRLVDGLTPKLPHNQGQGPQGPPGPQATWDWQWGSTQQEIKQTCRSITTKGNCTIDCTIEANKCTFQPPWDDFSIRGVALSALPNISLYSCFPSLWVTSLRWWNLNFLSLYGSVSCVYSRSTCAIFGD